jgi:hypothetical protein
MNEKSTPYVIIDINLVAISILKNNVHVILVQIGKTQLMMCFWMEE